MNLPPDHRNELDVRRQRARRTALWIAAVAVAVYVAFLMSGVLAQ